jgi:thiol-disulfide isomerase/thioredoxin
MKYPFFIVVLSIAIILITAGCVSDHPATVTVYFFYGEECPHCHNVMPFIQNLSEKYPEIDFRILEVWHNETNRALFAALNQELGIQQSGVPEVIVIGNTTPLIGDRDIPLYLEGAILEQMKKR